MCKSMSHCVVLRTKTCFFAWCRPSFVSVISITSSHSTEHIVWFSRHLKCKLKCKGCESNAQCVQIEQISKMSECGMTGCQKDQTASRESLNCPFWSITIAVLEEMTFCLHAIESFRKPSESQFTSQHIWLSAEAFHCYKVARSHRRLCVQIRWLKISFVVIRKPVTSCCWQTVVMSTVNLHVAFVLLC